MVFAEAMFPSFVVGIDSVTYLSTPLTILTQGAAWTSNCTLFTTSPSAPGCSSHGVPLMLLNSIPFPESSFGTLRMLLEKKNPCGVPNTAISDSSLILRKIHSCHFASTWTFFWTAPGKKPFQTEAHIDVAFLNDRGLCDSPSLHRFHGEIC